MENIKVPSPLMQVCAIIDEEIIKNGIVSYSMIEYDTKNEQKKEYHELSPEDQFVRRTKYISTATIGDMSKKNNILTEKYNKYFGKYYLRLNYKKKLDALHDIMKTYELEKGFELIAEECHYDLDEIEFYITNICSIDKSFTSKYILKKYYHLIEGLK
jgi:hypothetical protein